MPGPRCPAPPQTHDPDPDVGLNSVERLVHGREPHVGRLHAAPLDVGKHGPVVEPAALVAHHVPLAGAEGAHVRVRELGLPVHLALPVAQPAALDPEAPAAEAGLDALDQRGAHHHEQRAQHAEEEEEERHGARDAREAGLRERAEDDAGLAHKEDAGDGREGLLLQLRGGAGGRGRGCGMGPGGRGGAGGAHVAAAAAGGGGCSTLLPPLRCPRCTRGEAPGHGRLPLLWLLEPGFAATAVAGADSCSRHQAPGEEWRAGPSAATAATATGIAAGQASSSHCQLPPSPGIQLGTVPPNCRQAV